jgi:hypothetical protein
MGHTQQKNFYVATWVKEDEILGPPTSFTGTGLTSNKVTLNEEFGIGTEQSGADQVLGI